MFTVPLVMLKDGFGLAYRRYFSTNFDRFLRSSE